MIYSESANNSQTETEIHDFFEENDLTGDRLAQLLALASRIDTLTSKRRALRKAAPLMATVALLAASAGAVVGNKISYQDTASTGSVLSHVNNEMAPPVVALRFCAEWCRPSQEMAPRCERLVEEFGRENIVFVDFDMTDDITLAQSRKLAASLGVLDAWEELPHSGELVVIDRHRGEVLHNLTSEDDYPQMRLVMSQALARSN